METGDRALRKPALGVRVARVALAVTAAAYIAVFLGMSGLRISHPFELEWLEGAIADVVGRVLAGKPIYVRPTIEFGSQVYTPLYYWISALSSEIFGLRLFSLRLVSLLATLGSFALIFSMVRRETRSAYWGLVASGLFAATFEAGGAWFDLARVDSLFLLFLLAALHVGRTPRPSLGIHLATGALFFLAFFTKQSGLIAALALLPYFTLRNPRGSLALFGVLGAGVALSTWVLNARSDGWFLYYAVDLIGQQPVIRSAWLMFWGNDMLGNLPFAFPAAIAYVGESLLARRRDLFFPLALAGCLGISWSSRLHAGGWDNVLMPAFALTAVCATLGLAALVGHLGGLRPPLRAAAASVVAYLLCLGQFGMLVYDPRAQIPTAEDLAAGEALLERIRSFEGDVYVRAHGFIVTMAGKRPWAQRHSLHDVYRGTDVKLNKQLHRSVDQAYARQQWDAVIIDDGVDYFIRSHGEYYQLVPENLIESPTAFWPKTGARHRPQALFIARRLAESR